MEGGGGGGRWMDALCVRSPCQDKMYWSGNINVVPSNDRSPVVCRLGIHVYTQYVCVCLC